LKRCFICEETTGLQKHHVNNFLSNETILLCSSCHGIVRKLAHKLIGANIVDGLAYCPAGKKFTNLINSAFICDGICDDAKHCIEKEECSHYTVDLNIINKIINRIKSGEVKEEYTPKAIKDENGRYWFQTSKYAYMLQEALKQKGVYVDIKKVMNLS